MLYNTAQQARQLPIFLTFVDFEKFRRRTISWRTDSLFENAGMWTDIWEATVDFQNAVWLDTAWRDLEISPKPFYQWATHLFSESLHADQRATLLTVVKSDEFEIARGTEQGDLFSSSLFNSVLQSAMEKDIGIWKEKSCGIKLGDENKACMSNLRLADDVLLLASSSNQLKKIKKMHGSARARNPTRQNEGSYQPRVRHSERSRQWRDPGRNTSFFLKEKVKYLGQLIPLTDQETIEIQHRIRAWSRVHQTPTGIDTQVLLARAQIASFWLSVRLIIQTRRRDKNKKTERTCEQKVYKMMEEVSLPVHRKTKTVQTKGVTKTAACHSRTIQKAPPAKRRRRKAKKSHDDVEKLTRQSHDSIALTQHAAFSTITNDSNTRFLKVYAQLEKNRKQAETSTNMLEATQTRTS